jgi:hypothetical protein
MRAFQAMNHHHRQRILPRRLPVTKAQELDSRGYFDQTLLSRGQGDASREKEVGDSLQVSSAQATPGLKDLGLRIPHTLILNGKDACNRPSRREFVHANL